jgi:hypothetical protein
MYAVVQKNENEQYTMSGQLDRELTAATQRYAELLRLFLKDMHGSPEDLVLRLMPQLVRINEEGVMPLDANAQMIEEAKQNHAQEKERQDGLIADLKRVLKDGFPKDEDRLQVLKLLAQET